VISHYIQLGYSAAVACRTCLCFVYFIVTQQCHVNNRAQPNVLPLGLTVKKKENIICLPNL
jgi:hypothetical protein